jgi:hypothetical protein
MWLDKPTVEDRKPWVPVFRTRPGQTIEVILIGSPRRLFTHFYRRRTYPCTQHGCVLCKRHLPKRLYCWYPAAEQNGRTGLLELTALSEASLIQQMEPYTHEPSGVARVTRPRGRRNQPCIVEWRQASPSDLTRYERKSEDWCEEALLRLWDLPRSSGDLTNGTYALHIASIIEARIAAGDAES